jgi:hypothetical protein
MQDMRAGSRSRELSASPHSYDALLPREREVMRLWDAGMPREAIAARLQLALSYVTRTTQRYDDLDGPAFDMAEASEILRERILMFHPHVAVGKGRP